MFGNCGPRAGGERCICDKYSRGHTAAGEQRGARAQSGDQFQTQELYGPSDPETGVKAAVSRPEDGPHKGCNGHAVPARADGRAASSAGAPGVACTWSAWLG